MLNSLLERVERIASQSRSVITLADAILNRFAQKSTVLATCWDEGGPWGSCQPNCMRARVRIWCCVTSNPCQCEYSCIVTELWEPCQPC